eukprot:augustus_masked-scaffold_16-processed-gene-6.13-mRNA-1 protein AED:1.00 eAED:1.00 QI:0/-1/0/0/-1/1/1/0/366
MSDEKNKTTFLARIRNFRTKKSKDLQKFNKDVITFDDSLEIVDLSDAKDYSTLAPGIKSQQRGVNVEKLREMQNYNNGLEEELRLNKHKSAIEVAREFNRKKSGNKLGNLEQSFPPPPPLPIGFVDEGPMNNFWKRRESRRKTSGNSVNQGFQAYYSDADEDQKQVVKRKKKVMKKKKKKKKTKKFKEYNHRSKEYDRAIVIDDIDKETVEENKDSIFIWEEKDRKKETELNYSALDELEAQFGHLDLYENWDEESLFNDSTNESKVKKESVLSKKQKLVKQESGIPKEKKLFSDLERKSVKTIFKSDKNKKKKIKKVPSTRIQKTIKRLKSRKNETSGDLANRPSIVKIREESNINLLIKNFQKE